MAKLKKNPERVGGKSGGERNRVPTNLATKKKNNQQ